MKIGSFAKKHNISMDTIRHYLDLQLLLAEKIGTQYNFTQKDSSDLEEILYLKNLNFSLAEVQNILAYKRYNSNKTVEFRNHFRLFLEDKKQELVRHQQEIGKAISYVEDNIHQLKTENDDSRALGLPIAMVSSLRCPYCRNSLNLSEGIIENNMIISGRLHCKCHYSVVIENGIIVDHSAVRDKISPSKKEYYEGTSTKFINFIYKSMEVLINLIQSEEIKKNNIVEIAKCSGFFLVQYLPHLDKNTTYILVDYDYKRIKALKSNLELNSDHSNFIFLCCDCDKLPLMDNFIDLLIDSFATEEHVERNGMLLKESILPLMKDRGHLAGIYPYFSSINGKINDMSSATKKFLNKDHIMNMLRESFNKELYVKERGPVEEGGVYNTYVEENEYCHLIYVGQKAL